MDRRNALAPQEVEERLMRIIEQDRYAEAVTFEHDNFAEPLPIDEQPRRMKGALHLLALATHEDSHATAIPNKYEDLDDTWHLTPNGDQLHGCDS